MAFPNEVVMALITCSSNVSILYVSRRSTYRRTSMVFSRRNLQYHWLHVNASRGINYYDIQIVSQHWWPVKKGAWTFLQMPI
jgi:hypothetical protein